MEFGWETFSGRVMAAVDFEAVAGAPTYLPHLAPTTHKVLALPQLRAALLGFLHQATTALPDAAKTIREGRLAMQS